MVNHMDQNINANINKEQNVSVNNVGAFLSLQQLMDMPIDEFISVLESNYVIYIPENINLENPVELRYLTTVYIHCANAYSYLLFLHQWTDGRKRQLKTNKDSSPEAKAKELDMVRRDNAVQAALESVKNAKDTLSRVASFYRMEVDSVKDSVH